MKRVRRFHSSSWVFIIALATVVLVTWMIIARGTAYSDEQSFAIAQQNDRSEVASDSAVLATHFLEEKNSRARSSRLHVAFISQIGEYVENVGIQGRYAYVTESSSLAVVDILDPTTPSIVSKSPLSLGFFYGLEMGGDYAYITSGPVGLLIIDVANPKELVEVGRYNSVLGFTEDLAVSGNYAYLASVEDLLVTEEPGSLVIIDVTNPTKPTHTVTYRMSASAVEVSGDYLYVADNQSNEFGGLGNGWLRIIDISDPTEPVPRGSLDIEGNGVKIAVAGEYAYIATETHGLRIIDISDPSKLVEVGFFDVPALDVAVENDFAYVAAGTKGLSIIDISDPADPVEIASYNTSGVTSDVDVSGNYIYLADGKDGLLILRLMELNQHAYLPMILKPVDRLVFTSNEHGNDDIFRMDTDGGNRLRLTIHNAED